ncbi:fungus-induced protein 1-like [Uranotaenia lowii]|uniref:fungus-induced protein 1-like n=1 Tax=Uranotaenia lowii TaxID=190385 RepID=UPI00247B1071|nr:fungus-induced protein 1-like [Uranotaenia lowii]
MCKTIFAVLLCVLALVISSLAKPHGSHERRGGYGYDGYGHGGHGYGGYGYGGPGGYGYGGHGAPAVIVGGGVRPGSAVIVAPARPAVVAVRPPVILG